MSVKYSSIAMINEMIDPLVILEPKISISPNPVYDGKINVLFENLPEGKYSVIVSNVLGQKITNEMVKVQGIRKLFTINLVNYAPGIYKIVATNDNGLNTYIGCWRCPLVGKKI